MVTSLPAVSLRPQPALVKATCTPSMVASQGLSSHGRDLARVTLLPSASSGDSLVAISGSGQVRYWEHLCLQFVNSEPLHAEKMMSTGRFTILLAQFG